MSASELFASKEINQVSKALWILEDPPGFCCRQGREARIEGERLCPQPACSSDPASGHRSLGSQHNAFIFCMRKQAH